MIEACNDFNDPIFCPVVSSFNSFLLSSLFTIGNSSEF